MGGVGKTTFTKHINNILVEKKTQECVFWVTVSEQANIRVLQEKIAHVIRIDLSDENDEDKRAVRLHQALSSRKNFVLILDDVWKNINLEKVGIPLRMEGIKLIITTRSSRVCDQIGCHQVIRVEKLDKNEAWELFRDTLGQNVTLSPQVEETAQFMTDLCDGLPLGIITLAANMRGETEIHVWRNALEELRRSAMEHEDMEDFVFKVLKYSFDRLNPKHQQQEESNGDYNELQHCFLYCSLYPEDHEIKKEKLVRKFISEELVDKRKSPRAQSDQALTIVDRLVNVCLLESVDDSHVKMHDLLRAMALRITQGKHVVLAGCQLEQIRNEDKYWTQDVEKVSLMNNSIEKIPDGMSPNCPKLSTLLLQHNWELKFIADSFFSQMCGLYVLDLSECGEITKLPNSLSDLESLKALILGSCGKLVEVPYLGKLKALIELDLSYTAIREVPQGMDELVNLQFLSMYATTKLEILPAGLISKFQNLQCLHLPDQIEAPIIEMESLRNLEEFKGRANGAADFNRLIGCGPLLKYEITVGSFPVMFNPSSLLSDFNRIDVVECNWLTEDAVLFAQDAKQLRLLECFGLSKSLLDDFPKFSNPKSLQTLEIDSCEGIECILAKKEEIESHCTALLGTINSIELWSLRDFMGMIQKQEVVLPTPAQAVFSSLRELTIYNCDKMKNVGLTRSEFPNLELIHVSHCSEIEEIIEQGGVISFPKLKMLHLQYLPKLKNVGLIGSEFPKLESISGFHCSEIEEIIEQGGVVSFPKLKILLLGNLPKLQNVGATIGDSIEEIQIFGSKALKKVPLYFPVVKSSDVSYSPPPALKRIILQRREEEWWESLEWEHPSHKHLLKHFLYFQ